MISKNLFLGGLVVSLGATYVYKERFFKKDWDSRKKELTTVVSNKFQHSGAPSVEVADKAATCLADMLVSVAKKLDCSAEGDDVIATMGQCLTSNQEAQVVYQLAMATCIAESTK